MRTIITRYLNNLKTLKVFITGIEQILIDNMHKELDKLSPLISSLDVKDNMNEVQSHEEKMIESDEHNNEPLIDWEIDTDEKDFRIKFKDAASVRRFKSAFEDFSLSIGQLPLLFESSLISLVTYFELLISSLLHEHVKKHPESLSISKKELKYSDLVNFDSIEGAKEFLIEKELQALMYDGLKSWIDFFKNKIKIDTTDIDNHFEDVNEILNRRNLFVHNGGYINSIYLNKVSEHWTQGMKKGDRLRVDIEYLLAAMELLELYGIILGIKMWGKRRGDHADIVEYLHELTYECMLEKKWSVAEVAADFIMDFNLTEVDMLVSQMNKWLSIKRTNGLESIKESIEKLDLSAKERHYRICRYALLNEHDKVLEELKQGYPEKLKEEDIREWPIFEDFRESDYYQQLIQKQGSEHEVQLELVKTNT